MSHDRTEREHHEHHCCDHGVEEQADSLRSPTAAGDYTCPMHPEVRQDAPGDCPDCGMALEPHGPSEWAARVEYTCPMHPEIVRDEPGSCPKCGMALEPRTVTTEDDENPELVTMRRRLWVCAALTVPLVDVPQANDALLDNEDLA